MQSELKIRRIGRSEMGEGAMPSRGISRNFPSVSLIGHRCMGYARC